MYGSDIQTTNYSVGHEIWLKMIKISGDGYQLFFKHAGGERVKSVV